MAWNRLSGRQERSRRRLRRGFDSVPVGSALAGDIAGRRTLRDPVTDALLADQGFVVVDLLDDDQLAALKALCDAHHPTVGAGWESDFHSTDLDLKQAVNDGIRDIFAPLVTRDFVDHVSVLHNLILNWPGSEAGLALHQHSTVVDELAQRATFIWCALTEATEQNGTLHVVPRSDRVQLVPRPERSPSWHEPHNEQLMRDHLVSVSLRPGQAVVFDNHLLHCTLPNTTASPRISVGVLVIPASAQFAYYDSLEPGRANVYPVDPEFFIQNVTTHGLWAPPDGLDPLKEVEWTPLDLSPSQISELFSVGTCSHLSN